jgi:hypothetical protein
MPYLDLMVDGYLYLVRMDDPQVPEVDAVLQRAKEAAVAAGEPILTMWLGSGSTPLPQGEVRRALSSGLKLLLQDCEVHNVIEGGDFKTKILRSLVTNLYLLSGYRGRMFVYRSLDEALLALDTKLRRRGIDPPSVRAEALRRGLAVSADEGRQPVAV